MEQLKHSGLGLASFIISTGAALLIFVLFIAAGAMEASTPGGIDEESVGAVVLGLLIILCMFIELIALGLGIGALCQSGRNKIFGVLGTIFSAVIVLLTILVIILGNSM
ncbi:hypothetical protein [Pseudomonas mangrovi]|uniref:DUF4064 domain-containing protein n=1 Tax=Pseudomonas mangrovi TaxID=2161748 RepID=A0A2T5P6S0_9PSED|nr:hypothetical protein [Pseudomonas mangrovi]PTU73397.1 hypothetical protein DBO85_13750 [Pseudomonas mangrovi]